VTFDELETGVVRVDTARRQVIGVRTLAVGRQPLSLRIRAVGRVTYDESRIEDVTVRVDGWVERLRANVTGQAIQRGDTLFTMYSPDLLATQQELLALIESDDRTSERLAELVRTRLRLWGLSTRQIGRIEESGEALETISIRSPADGFIIEKNVFEGGHVTAGERVFQIAALDRVWVEAQVYESDLPHIAVGLPVTVTFPHTRHDPIETEIAYIYPYLAAETRTARVRLELDNPALELLPEMYADVEIEVALGDVLAVPVSAVIYTGPRRLVFVDLGEGRLQPREIEIGSRSGQFYEVLSGLSEGDVVVSSGNFLVAAESRIRSAADFWGATDEAE
jgi:Cu(I)/Ag(I) efflux system membrane fusion protein